MAMIDLEKEAIEKHCCSYTCKVEEEVHNLSATEAPRYPLRTVLDKIRQSKRRMERTLKQLRADMQWGLEEIIEKAEKKARYNIRRKVNHKHCDFNKGDEISGESGRQDHQATNRWCEYWY